MKPLFFLVIQVLSLSFIHSQTVIRDAKWPEPSLADAVRIAVETDSTFTDIRDGNVYRMAPIGKQVWMTENLRYLPQVDGPKAGLQAYDFHAPFFHVYGYVGTEVSEAKATQNYKIYGVLYSWSAAMAGFESSNTNPSQVQGVCPAGWHLPSKAEFETLTAAVGNNGNALKAIGAGEGFGVGANTSGFSARLSGGRYSGFFNHLGEFDTYWSSFQGNSSVAYTMGLLGSGGNVYGEYQPKNNGYRVRCVKD